MIILGVDPGSIIAGFGFIETDGTRFQVLEAGPIRLKNKGELPQRLLCLAEELETRIRKYKPEAISLEKAFYGKNVQSALVLGHVRGVVMLLAARYKIKLAEYAATEVKRTVTGYGRAEKAQVQEMVRVLLNLKEVPKPEDVADALALAICHAHTGDNTARYQEVTGQTRIPKGTRSSWRNWKPPGGA